jgi:hypothetical protein
MNVFCSVMYAIHCCMLVVRFLLMPSQQVATQRCLLSQSVSELKQLFAVEMKLSEDLILVVLDGELYVLVGLMKCQWHEGVRCEVIDPRAHTST